MPKNTIEDKILSLLKHKSDKTFSLESLIDLVPKKYRNKKIVGDALKTLQEKGAIVIDSKNSIRFLKKETTIDSTNAMHQQGVVDITRSGAIYVIVDGLERDIFIRPNRKNNFLKGDVVLVHLSKSVKEGKRPEGVIEKIIQRNPQLILGQIEVSPNHAFVKPKVDWLQKDIYISNKQLKGAKTGDYVAVRITQWEETDRCPRGELVQILNYTNKNDLTMQSFLLESSFESEFPAEVIQESEAIDFTIPKSEIKNRLDYRKVTTFTIDPLDAKDFDDALSVKKLADNLWEIGVHIADVSYYVRPDSAMDKEAVKRGTSVYMPDRVCPMLPERLSNGVCSLRPNEDKLCFSVLFEVNEQHKILKYTFAKTIIHSNKRYTYEDAQEIIENKKGDFSSEILLLNDIATSFRNIRFKNGAIAFEAPEVRFKLDAEGKPISVYTKERKAAHLLVEDWMLKANEAVAIYMSSLQNKPHNPFVYRIHDKPNLEKLQTFRNIAQRFGHNLMKFEKPDDAAPILNTFLETIKDKPELSILQQFAIRCMAKAIYTTKNIGHYGLAFTHYAHFTSPIRRYPDIMAHRLLFDTLHNKRIKYTDGEVEEICGKNSQMERAASECERKAIKYKQAEYLSERIGEEFEGVISGMIQRGFWVELSENKCEGFVDAQTVFTKENFVFDEENLILQGLNSNKTCRVGDRVQIKVTEVVLDDSRIWFELV